MGGIYRNPPRWPYGPTGDNYTDKKLFRDNVRWKDYEKQTSHHYKQDRATRYSSDLNHEKAVLFFWGFIAFLSFIILFEILMFTLDLLLAFIVLIIIICILDWIYQNNYNKSLKYGLTAVFIFGYIIFFYPVFTKYIYQIYMIIYGIAQGIYSMFKNAIYGF